MEKKYMLALLFCVSVLAVAAGSALAQSVCPAPRQSADVCIQVVSWAKDPQTGNCCEYGTPCNAPQGWSVYYSESECKNTQLDSCQGAGKFCGGIAAGAFQCCGGLTCKLDGTYPDAGGTCVAGENKCGNGICETEEAAVCYDCALGAINCASYCVQPSCPRDCVSPGGVPGPAGDNPNRAEIERRIAEVRLQLISLIRQLIEVLTGMLPK